MTLLLTRFTPLNSNRQHARYRLYFNVKVFVQLVWKTTACVLSAGILPEEMSDVARQEHSWAMRALITEDVIIRRSTSFFIFFLIFTLLLLLPHHFPLLLFLWLNRVHFREQLKHKCTDRLVMSDLDTVSSWWSNIKVMLYPAWLAELWSVTCWGKRSLWQGQGWEGTSPRKWRLVLGESRKFRQQLRLHLH